MPQLHHVLEIYELKHFNALSLCYILFRNLIVALSRLVLQDYEPVFLEENLITNYRSSPPEVFLGKRALKIWSKFTGEHPCQSANLLKSHFGTWVLS